VADRIAQTVVARHLEQRVEPVFHQDSYGYRPGRSQLDAIAACRRRCWKKDWVVDLGIQQFFDRVPWDLMVKAVEAHTDARWVLLYVKRWLAAPLQRPDGTLVERDRGTPRGSAVSPVLANLFLQYAFDAWMAREFPDVTFERYVDDAVVHCVSERQAHMLVKAIGERMVEVRLRLHPDKTKVVYCKGGKQRTRDYPTTSFTFLGFTFRARAAQDRNGEILRQWPVRPARYGWFRAFTTNPSTPTWAFDRSSQGNAWSCSVVRGISCKGGATSVNSSSRRLRRWPWGPGRQSRSRSASRSNAM
jgi:group II intron reverse transcriptase/maturase